MQRMERRRFRREGFSAPASIATESAAAHGTVLDLSICGVLFEAGDPGANLRLGDVVTLRTSGNGEDIVAVGRIVHCSDRLFGIAFDHLDVESRRSIRRVLESKTVGT